MIMWLRVCGLSLVAGSLMAGSLAKAEDKWAGEVAAVEARLAHPAPEPGGVVFAGSSTIRLWDVAAAFPWLRPLNAGFGGSQFADCQRYAPRLVHPWKPGTVVVYCGSNDLAAGHSPDEVVHDFFGFASELHAAVPGCRLLVLSILPSPARWHLWPQASEVNARMRALCEAVGEPRMRFVDVAPALLRDDGQPMAELYVEDRLHLNANGYEVLKSTLAPLLPAARPEVTHPSSSARPL